MGMTALQAPVSGWGPRLLKSSVTGPCLLGNCYLENKLYKKLRKTTKSLCTQQYLYAYITLLRVSLYIDPSTKVYV